MAYTSVIPVRRLDRAVKYVMNKEKTTAVDVYKRQEHTTPEEYSRVMTPPSNTKESPER